MTSKDVVQKMEISRPLNRQCLACGFFIEDDLDNHKIKVHILNIHEIISCDHVQPDHKEWIEVDQPLPVLPNDQRKTIHGQSEQWKMINIFWFYSADADKVLHYTLGRYIREHWVEKLTGVRCDGCHTIREMYPSLWKQWGMLNKTDDGRDILFRDELPDDKRLAKQQMHSDIDKEIDCIPLSPRAKSHVKRVLLSYKEDD